MPGEPRHLLHRLYHSGLGNQLLSLDVGVGLAHLTDRALVLWSPPGPTNPQSADPRFGRVGMPIGGGRPFEIPAHHQGLVDADVRSTILDLFDVPGPSFPLDDYLAHRGSPRESQLVPRTASGHLSWLLRAVFRPPVDALEHHRLDEFAAGIEQVLSLDEEQREADALLVDAETMANPARFFAVGDESRRGLQRVLRRIEPKYPFRDFAAFVCEQLGPFHAVHIRRTDFKNFLTGATRTLTPDDVVRSLAELFPRNDLLLICTDESDDDAFFRPLREHFVSSVFLDRFLRDEPVFRRRFRELPRRDEIALGLVTMLIASEAERFAGTMGSTFTGYIHRRRLASGREPVQRFAYNEFPQVAFEDGRIQDERSGAYSWNRIHPDLAHPGLAWFREWPEITGFV